MVSKEVVLSMPVRSHKTDPVQVWIYQTMTALRTKRVGSRSEDVAADVTTVLKHLGWDWKSALETRTKDEEKLRIIPSSAGYWRYRNVKERGHGGSPGQDLTGGKKLGHSRHPASAARKHADESGSSQAYKTSWTQQ